MFKIMVLILILMLPVSGSAYGQVVNKVVAVINNEVITRQDVNQLLAVLYAQYVQEYEAGELLDKMEEAKKDILIQMIEDRLILSYAKKLNIRVLEEEIDRKLESVKDGFPSEEVFYNTIETQGITIADLKNRYKDQVMMKKVLDFEVKSRIAVLPSEISEYYEQHREDFKLDEKYKVRHILIKAVSEVDFELAKIEIEGVYKKLREGEDFAKLASLYSQGPNKDKGGDMGFIGKGEMLKELDQVIFNLKPGESSGPIKSKIGYHILKIEDITHSGYLSLEDVQGNIKARIFQKKFKEKLNEWLGKLRSEAYISIK